MCKLQCFKVVKESKVFRLNQKVWLIQLAGNNDGAMVVGKYRGKGRYVKAWTHWKSNCPPRIIECDVTERFYKKIVGYDYDSF